MNEISQNSPIEKNRSEEKEIESTFSEKNSLRKGFSAGGGKVPVREDVFVRLWRGARETLGAGASYKVLFVSLMVNFLALDYIILSQSTTLRLLFAQNIELYNYASVVLSLLNALFFALSVTMLVYLFEKRRRRSAEAAPTTLAGAIFAALASGCPVCGAWGLSLLGIAGSLAVFPWQGLEIKAMALFLLVFGAAQAADNIAGLCDRRGALRRWAAALIVIAVLSALLYFLPELDSDKKSKFQRAGVEAPTEEQLALEADLEKLAEQVNPSEGFALTINFGNIGYRLVKDGAIDFEKFKAVYDRAGTPLTEKQLKVFTPEGLNEPIVINRENSYFLLNLFWAFGLANKNPVLTEGEIVTRTKGRVERLASTGGWTIAAKPLEEFMAKSRLAVLTEEQQIRLQKVAENVYRPCCGNSTAFPDCNHGMALLGVLQLMAANDATEDEMFEAAKYFSAYWFPQQALDVAVYFKLKENIDFADLDARTFVSRQYFSARGWTQVKNWVLRNLPGIESPASGGGGGCGVESGAPPSVAPSAAPLRQLRPAGGGGCGV